MRVKSIRVRNFRAIEDVKIEIPHPTGEPGSADFVTLIGPNNIGKSSVLEAIRLSCAGDIGSITDRHFPNFAVEENEVEVTVTLNDISEVDRKNASVAKCEADGEISVRQIWKSTAKEDHICQVKAYEYELAKEITDLKLKEIKENEETRHAYDSFVEEQDGKEPKSFTQALQKHLLNYGKERGLGFVVSTGEASFENRTGLSSVAKSHCLPRVIYIPALKETKTETDSKASRSSTKALVDLLFDQYLSSQKEIVAFNRALADLEKMFERSDTNPAIAHCEDQMRKAIRGLIDLHPKLQFDRPDISSNLRTATRLRLRNGAVETEPEEQGHGAQRAIVLMLLQVLERVQAAKNEELETKPLLLLIEEPEIYLHPHMTLKMRDVLLRLAKRPNITVICTSHSPFFIDLADRHGGVVKCEERNGRLWAYQRSDDLFEEDSRERMRMLLNFDPSVNSAFFTKNVTLVEGDTEAAALAALQFKLIECGLDANACRQAFAETTIVNCRGKGTIQAFQQVLNGFQIPFRVVHDRDVRKENEDSTNKAQETMNANIRAGTTDPDTNVLMHDDTFEPVMFGEKTAGNKAFNTWERIQKLNFQDDSVDADKWKEFFAFCTHCSVDELAAPPEPEQTLAGFGANAFDALVDSGRRRDFRDKLQKVGVLETELAEKQPLQVAAGTSRIPDDDAEDCFYEGKLIGSVVGDSMSNTLLPGDCVLLEKVDYLLRSIDPESDETGLSAEEFQESIDVGAVYLVALNDDIERGEYTLKRVRVSGSGADWILIIEADNRDTDWGHNGRVIVEANDSVHFACKLVGLLEPSS